MSNKREGLFVISLSDDMVHDPETIKAISIIIDLDTVDELAVEQLTIPAMMQDYQTGEYELSITFNSNREQRNIKYKSEKAAMNVYNSIMDALLYYQNNVID